MRTVLCRIGLHSWREFSSRTTRNERSVEVFRECRNCPRLEQFVRISRFVARWVEAMDHPITDS